MNAATAALASRTKKGKGVPFLEDASGWNGKSLNREQMAKALDELGETANIPAIKRRRVGQVSVVPHSERKRLEVYYRSGDHVATRQAFGNALEKLGQVDPTIVALTAM